MSKYLCWCNVRAVLLEEQVLHELGELHVLEITVLICVVMEPNLRGENCPLLWLPCIVREIFTW